MKDQTMKLNQYGWQYRRTCGGGWRADMYDRPEMWRTDPPVAVGYGRTRQEAREDAYAWLDHIGQIGLEEEV